MGEATPPAELEWFFIDSNKAFRGPVNETTLHQLLASGAITGQTYIFAEHLGTGNAWVRLKRLPELFAAISAPRGPVDGPIKARHGGGRGMKLPAPPTHAPAAAAPAAENSSACDPTASSPSNEASSADLIAAPSTAASAPPSSTQPSRTNAAPTRSLNEQSDSQAPELLFQHFRAAPNKPSPVRPSSGRSRWLFGSRKSSPEAALCAFGKPVRALTLDGEGMPVLLSRMRQQLFGMNGHLVEGIFRVSPGAAELKLARRHLDAGQLAKVASAECLAQLIKLWFRELPESVLGPCLQPVVDGPPSTGKECAALLTQLPQPQLAIVRWLLRLMLDISAHEPVNRMTPKSMAVVFAPNLVDPPPTMAPMDAFEVNRRVVTFVERLIEHEVTPAHLDEPTWRS